VINKFDDYCYISLGGWCGTRMALDQLELTNDTPHNIFDYVRSSSKGIIKCVEDNFESFLPENEVKNTQLKGCRPIIGEHFGFFHQKNLTDKSVLDSFDRKKTRFIQQCNGNKKCIFVRTCVLFEYEEELADMKTFQTILTNKYPKLPFIIIFVIPEQKQTTYYNNFTDKIFIFGTTHGENQKRGWELKRLGEHYKNIFEFISTHDMFDVIPSPNLTSNITRPSNKLCLFRDIPVVNYFKKKFKNHGINNDS
jgi:hypothetical protein